MSIVIGRIENKFWSNSDWKFPNAFPVYEEQKELRDEEPNMNDFFSGTIYLYGDHWNHCIYKGGYYALQILQTIDEDQKYYCYRLEREWWFDILTKRPRVVGDLGNSNNDELLERHLSRTVSAIDNPARIITINFGEVDTDWTKRFTFKKSTKDIEQIILSKDSLDAFMSCANTKTIKNWRKIDKNFYSGINNWSCFIFSYLRETVTKDGWKNRLRRKINEFVEGIPANSENLKISKVKTPANSKLIGNYCITHKQDGISDTEESVILEKIDLEGLTDIVAINFYDLQEKEPDTLIGEGLNPGWFDTEIEHDLPGIGYLAKIRRKPYIPLTATNQTIISNYEKNKSDLLYKTSLKEWSSSDEFAIFAGREWNDFAPMQGRFKDHVLNYNWKIQNPQKIVWSYNNEENLFYAWWIDNINFVLQFTGVGDFRENLNEYSLGEGWEKIPFEAPRPWSHHHINNPFLIEKYNVPFGFLIFGLERTFKDWRLFEYKNTDRKNRIDYFSGIKNELIKQYRQGGQWWSILTEDIKAIQPSKEFIKFYLDNYYFSWLAFFSNTARFGLLSFWAYKETALGTPYFENDYWGVFPYIGNDHYLKPILCSDIHNPQTRKWAALNPFNDDRFPGHKEKVDRTLKTLLERSTLHLPNGLYLETGDYFLTDLEYSIDLYDDIGDLTFTAERQSGLIGWLTGRKAFKVEDFVDGKVKEKNIFRAGDKRVVLCSNLDGGIELRTIEVFNAIQELSRSKTQIVKSVDDVDHRVSQFTLIKKIKTLTARDEEFKGESEELKKLAIHAFYKLHGYKTKERSGDDGTGATTHWTWFNDSDFSAASDKQLLFDLVGTDWYCFIAKGKISLIAKDKNLFSASKGKSTSLLHSENKDLNLSLLEKVNQKVRFQFLSAPYYLNWKTTFSNKDRISLSFESISPVEQQTQFEQYFIKLDTGFDQIYYENIAVPKKQTKSLSLADSVTIERLNLEMARDQYSYQIDQNKLKLATDRYEESIRRAQTELDHQRLETFLSLGTSSVSGAVATGIATRYSKASTITRTKQRWQNLGPGDAPTLISTRSKRAGMSAAYVNKVPVLDVTKIHRYSKLPSLGAAGVMFAAKKAKDMVMNFGFRFPERQRQINVEKQLGASELAIESLVMNTSHMERQLNAQLALNQVYNVYDNPIINEREIIEQFMKKKDWHGGKQLNNAYLMVFVPSEEQLIQLKSYKEEYGVMCDIPDVETIFYDGMPADVIRYRNLDDGAILGIDNPLIREAFRARLLAGLKIIETATYRYRLLTSNEYMDRIYRLNNDLYEKSNQLKTKEDENIKLIHQVNVVKTELLEKHTSEKNQLTDRIAEIERELNEVNTQLRKKIEEAKEARERCQEEIAKLQKQSEDDKFKLNEEIEKHKEDKEELTQKLNDERRLVLQKTEEVNSLKKQKENLENQKADVERQLREAIEAKKQVETDKVKEVEEAKKTGRTLDCNYLKELLDYKFDIDIKKRENGWSAFRDLAVEILEGIIWMRRSGLDAKLMKYPDLKNLIEKMNELELIPLMDKLEDTLKQHGWDGYKKWLGTGGEAYGEVANIIKGMKEVEAMETIPNVHAVKVLIDELNWLSYKAKQALKNELNTDTDLQFMFGHVYPGKTIDLYKAVFGNPNVAIWRKRFTENLICGPAGQDKSIDSIGLLDQIKREINYGVTDVPKGEKERTYIAPKAGEPGVGKRILQIKGYDDEPPADTMIFRLEGRESFWDRPEDIPYSEYRYLAKGDNPWFKDKFGTSFVDHKMSRGLYFADFQDRVAESQKWEKGKRYGDDRGEYVDYVYIWNYPYYPVANKKAAWVKYDTRSKNYISEVYFFRPSKEPKKMIEAFREVMRRRNELVIPDWVLDKWKSGQLTLGINYLAYSRFYDYYILNFVPGSKEEIYDDTATFSGGKKDSVYTAYKWIKIKSDGVTNIGDSFIDFIKVLIILESFHADIREVFKTSAVSNKPVYDLTITSRDFENVQARIDQVFFSDQNRDYVNINVGVTFRTLGVLFDYVTYVINNPNKTNIPHPYEYGKTKPVYNFLNRLWVDLRP